MHGGFRPLIHPGTVHTEVTRSDPLSQRRAEAGSTLDQAVQQYIDGNWLLAAAFAQDAADLLADLYADDDE